MNLLVTCEVVLSPFHGMTRTFAQAPAHGPLGTRPQRPNRKSTRLNSSHSQISYAVFCLKKKKQENRSNELKTPPQTLTIAKSRFPSASAHVTGFPPLDARPSRHITQSTDPGSGAYQSTS